MQTSTYIDEESSFERRSVVNDFIDIIQGKDTRHQLQPELLQQTSVDQVTVEEDIEEDQDVEDEIDIDSKIAF